MINHGYLLGAEFLFANENNITEWNISGAYLIVFVYATGAC